ncbi:MAG: exodeoxyribonuclease VII small subunit [Bdellovibrionota bacterium]
MDFEKKLKRLEEIVFKMEKGDLPLEDSLKLFEEGVTLSRECHKRLNEAESQVKVLMGFDEKGQTLTKNFVAEEN